MRSNGISALGGLVLACACAYSQTVLDFRPADARYSKVLDKIILIAESPNQLHIYDPVTQADSTVDLPGSPVSLAISPNGFTAAVGMDSKIVLVNLSTRAVTRTLSVTGTVRRIIAANDYLHYDTGDYYTAYSISIGTGVITNPPSPPYEALRSAVLDDSGNYIYSYTSSRISRIDVSTGPMTTNEGKYIPGNSCSYVIPVLSGNRMISPCGDVYSATANKDTDRKYLGSHPLPFPQGLAAAASTALNRTALLAAQPYYSNPVVQRDNQIYLFNSVTLQPTGRLLLADFKPAATAYAAHGKWMFFDAAGQTLHVISQADLTSGLLRDFALQSFPLSNPDPCVPTLTPASSVSVPWSGTTSTVNASAATSCLYTAVSSADWLQVVQYPQNSGTADIRFHARVNLAQTSRSATLTIGGQDLTVTQDAAPAPLPTSWRMSYSVADVEKSDSLDKIVVAPKDLNELHILDTGAGTNVVVPLSRKPNAVSVRPDGQVAAVGQNGLISLVNVQSGTLVSEIPIGSDVYDLAYAANGYIYVSSSSSNCCAYYSVNVAQSEVSEGYYNGPRQSMRVHPSGEYLYAANYSIDKWRIDGKSVTSMPINNYVYGSSVWLTQDGGRLFSAAGNVYRTSSNPATDLTQNGSLNNGSGVAALTWADHSALRSAVAVTSMTSGSYPYRYGIHIYGDEFLGLSASYSLPTMRIGDVDYTNEGRFVFWSKDGNRLTALSRLTGTTALLNDSVLTTISANIGSNGCTAALSGSSATVVATGQAGSVTVTAANGCNWTSTSNASWLRVTAGSFGIGTSAMYYIADRNPYGLPRQGILNIGGQTFTVNQAAGTPTAVPSLVSVTPASPTTVTAAVTFTARDLDGFANLSRIYFQIGDSTAITANGCHGFYDRNSNQVALYNDGLTGLLPGLTIGTSSTVENSQCRVNGTGSSVVSAAGTDLSITLSMALKGAYLQGNKKLYVWVTDQQNNGTGWVESGTWTPAVPVNVAPTVVAFTPATANGATQTLTVQARDGNGADDISRVYFLVNGNTVIPQNGCHGYYERGSNRIFLYNDGLTNVVGFVTPGGTGSIENSQCKVNAATSGMTVTDGVNLNLTLGMEVRGAYSTGTRNVYYWVVDAAAAGTGWVTGTAWSATTQPTNQPPTVVSGSPSTISTATETLTFTVRDLDGYTNLSRVYFLINPTLTIPANTCHGIFDRAANTFYLYGDGLSTVASLPAGTTGTLQNSQCAIDVAQSQVSSASGSDLSFTLRVTLKGSLTSGTQKVALWAQDAQGNGTGWIETANWTVTAGVGPTAPTFLSVSPSNTTTASTTFTVTARDANGSNTISRVYFLINSTPTIPANGCHGFYDQALHAVYLYNDALNAVLGPVRPGQSGQSAANGQCSISGAGFTVSSSGTDLTLTLPVTVTGSYVTGNRNLYFWAVDTSNLGTGWQTGAVIALGAPVTPAAPVIASATPSSASGNGRLFTVTARDANGATDLNRVYFLVAPSATIATNSCHGFYERSSNKVYLYNAGLTALVSGSITPGVAGGLSNGQCSLDGASSTISISGNDLTLGLHLTRLGSYTLASLNVYWWAVDYAATGTGWVPGSGWAP